MIKHKNMSDISRITNGPGPEEQPLIGAQSFLSSLDATFVEIEQQRETVQDDLAALDGIVDLVEEWQVEHGIDFQDCSAQLRSQRREWQQWMHAVDEFAVDNGGEEDGIEGWYNYMQSILSEALRIEAAHALVRQMRKGGIDTGTCESAMADQHGELVAQVMLNVESIAQFLDSGEDGSGDEEQSDDDGDEDGSDGEEQSDDDGDDEDDDTF